MLELAARTAAAVGPAKEALDVQVLDGLDTFLATERFLCKLEAARAEWMDLSHRAADDAAAHGAHAPPHGGALAAAAAAHVHPAAHPPASDGGASSDDEAYAAARGGGGGGFESSSSGGPLSASPPDAADAAVLGPSSHSTTAAEPAAAAAAAAAAVGDFVVINKDDAVEAMAYYIAMYISRMPEAQRMGPKELQGALKETFAILRRSKWRLVWSWGRTLYRGAAVSFSALQLYQNPWLLRAVLSALWASSRLLYAQLA